jgi:lipoprotein-releasing system permease protein
VPWYLYLALKQLFPTGRKFPFFTAISILGVALGVALLVVSTSVMAGFGHEIRKKIVETQGDVQIRAEGLVPDADALAATVAKVPGVVASARFAAGPVLLRLGGRTAFPMMQGVDLEHTSQVIPLDSYLLRCSLDDLDDDAVFLGINLYNSLQARIGDSVDIYSIQMLDETQPDVVTLPRTLRIRGVLEIGHQALDESTLLVTMRTMQDIYRLGAATKGLNVKLAEGEDPDAAARRINAVLPAGVHAESWLTNNQDFLFIITLEKNMIFILLLFIIIVAAFSVTSSLLISVVRKTREIGLLGALGANPRQVAACFCFQGFLIGLGGTVAGLGLGLGTLHFRNEIIAVFTRLTASEEALARFYQFSQLPAYTTTADLTLIVSLAVIISTLAGLLPAWRAAKLRPVEALRSE